LKIAFFIGSVDISGGTYVIYQHALHAKRAGHDVTMVVLYPYDDSQMQWHPACKELRFVPLHESSDLRFDLAIATWWRTAAELHAIAAARYAYFIQSIESRFYPDNQAPLKGLVDRSYDIGLPSITEASWIREHLSKNHRTQAVLVRNGIRKDLYTQEGPSSAERLRDGPIRVLVEGPMGVFFKNVGRSLKLARKSKADSTWLLTSTQLGYFPGVDKVFSRVPISLVPAIYRSCDVLVKLSYVEGMFGPPLEMFHCGGTAIVYDVTGYDEYIENGENAIVIPRDDESSVVAAINSLRDDNQLLDRLKDGALSTALAWPDWTHSSTEFLRAIESIQDSPSRGQIEASNHVSMQEYISAENDRLGSLVPDNKMSTKVLNHLTEKSSKFAAARRYAGFLREAF